MHGYRRQGECNGLPRTPCFTNTTTQEDNGIDFIFHTNTESGKTDDLQEHSEINLAFLNPSGEWASISGTASIETDRSRVEKYYSPSLKAWLGDLGDGKHDGGPQDPRIGLIKVTSKTAQYATSRRTAIGGAVEFAKGVVTGETAQVNKLRHIEANEIEQCKFPCDETLRNSTLTMSAGRSGSSA
jgi:general stress protein 26